jgi:hypothetical protein
MAKIHTLESRWNEKIPAMKKAFPKELVDEDVKYVSEGHRELLENIAAKIGKSYEDTIIWLDSL